MVESEETPRLERGTSTYRLDCLLVELESSTALPEVGIDSRRNPVIRSRTLKAGSRPQLGKKIVVATIDDLTSPKRLQLEVTVTRLP